MCAIRGGQLTSVGLRNPPCGGETPHPTGKLRLHCLRRTAWSFEGGLNVKGGATAEFGLEVDAPAVALDDAVADAEPEAGAERVALGREERLEDARQDLGLDA